MSSLIVEQICSNFLPGKTGYIVRMQEFLLLIFQELYAGGAVSSHVHNIFWDAQPKDTVCSFQLTLFYTKVALEDDLYHLGVQVTRDQRPVSLLDKTFFSTERSSLKFQNSFGLKGIRLDTQATLGEWHLSDGWLSWLVWFHISSNLAGQAGRVFVIAFTSRRVTPWSSSGSSMQQTLETASAIMFVLPWMYLISTLYLAIFRRSLR